MGKKVKEHEKRYLKEILQQQERERKADMQWEVTQVIRNREPLVRGGRG